MEMDKHRTAEWLSTNGVRAEIEKTVKDYFARYAQSLPNQVRDERERYVIDCCLKRATETEEQYQRANADTNAFVLGVLFSQCISEETRGVTTPLGDICAYPKHKINDSPEDYPGIYVDLIKGEEKVLLACVEYVPPSESPEFLQTCVYGDCIDDEPTDIRVHTNVDAINKEEE